MPQSKSLRSPRPARRPHTGLNPIQEQRLRRKLRTIACSESWVDAQIREFIDRSPDGREIIYRFHDSALFPPGGKTGTTMRWCRHCARYTPPACLHLIERRTATTTMSSTLICDDCRIAADELRFREIYEAGLFLRPSGNSSFVQMRQLRADRQVRGH